MNIKNIITAAIAFLVSTACSGGAKQKKVMNKQLMAIIWNGRELPDSLVEKIATIFTANGIANQENISIVYDTNVSIKEISGKSLDMDECIKNAIIYIGERFKDTLANNKLLFAIELSSAVNNANAKMNFNAVSFNEEDEALLNAIQILASASMIPKRLSEKYHITKDTISIIKNIYDNIG